MTHFRDLNRGLKLWKYGEEKRTGYDARKDHLEDGIRAGLHERPNRHDDHAYEKRLLAAEAVP